MSGAARSDAEASDGIGVDPATRAAIVDAWGLGTETTFAPFGTGLINRTLIVRDGDRELVLQRLNTDVFRSPETVIANAVAVTGHLRREHEAGRYRYDVVDLVATRSGAPALTLAGGEWWRLYRYVPHAAMQAGIVTPALAREAARAFGAFARALGTLPTAAVGEVIPGFHDPDLRIDAFRHALAADAAGRAADCGRECGSAAAFAELAGAWRELKERGLPLRVVHNDTKLDNVLFDANGKAIAVIDLDTVMPGSPLIDFGDLARSALNAAVEDGASDAADLRRDVFAALAQGYLEGAGALITDIERDHLVLGVRLVTGMLALRFLTDHLDGDRYFRIERPGQNLDRARRQFTLLAALTEAKDDLQALVRSVTKEVAANESNVSRDVSDPA